LAACGETGESASTPPVRSRPLDTPEVPCVGATVVVATPLQTGLGGMGDLYARSNTQTVSYAWTGSRGVRLSNSQWPDASFTCVAAGAQALTLTVTGPGQCIQRYDVDITCVGS
jgi:hypothetical protein